MIIVSNTVYDADGQVIIRDWSPGAEYDSTARISRAKTLDGGGAISNYGFSVTDRTLAILCRVTSDEFQILKGLHEESAFVRISTWEGSFSGYIYRLKSLRDGRTTAVFYFTAKLT